MKGFSYLFALLLIACNNQTNEEFEVPETETIREKITPQPVAEKQLVDTILMNYLKTKSWLNDEPHESGVYIVIDEPGTGKERPGLTDEITLFYKGYLMNGQQFDGTKEIPMTFALNELIKGWQIGIPHFGKGGKGKLIIPPHLGYGKYDSGPIPGNSTLLFEIELVDWNTIR